MNLNVRFLSQLTESFFSLDTHTQTVEMKVQLVLLCLVFALTGASHQERHRQHRSHHHHDRYTHSFNRADRPCYVRTEGDRPERK